MIRANNVLIIDGNIFRFVLDEQHLVVEWLNKTPEATWIPLARYWVPRKFDMDFFFDILWRTLQEGSVDIWEVILDVNALTEQS